MFKMKYHKFKINNQPLSIKSPRHKQQEFNEFFHMQKCIDYKP